MDLNFYNTRLELSFPSSVYLWQVVVAFRSDRVVIGFIRIKRRAEEPSLNFLR